MAVPRSRISQSRRDKRRSHHAKQAVNVNACSECGELRQPHRVCPSCGSYKGRQVVDMSNGGEE